MCYNTQQGRDFITDDLGNICFVDTKTPNTGCCHLKRTLAKYRKITQRKKGLTGHEISLADTLRNGANPAENSYPFEKHSCFGCNEQLHCCLIYEFCVSCCMSPQVPFPAPNLLESANHDAANAITEDAKSQKWKPEREFAGQVCLDARR